MDLSSVREMLTDKKNLLNPLSLDKYVDDSDESQSLWELIEDKNEDTIWDIMDRSDKKVNISEILDRLTPMEADIIKWRFGFKDSQYHAMKDIAKKLKISPSKVKDIESVAIIKLKRLITQSDVYDLEKSKAKEIDL